MMLKELLPMVVRKAIIDIGQENVLSNPKFIYIQQEIHENTDTAKSTLITRRKLEDKSKFFVI